MKFAEHLLAHITPEWRKQYINYEEMKALLYAAVEQAPSGEVVEPEVLSRYFAKFDEQFFHYCDKELTKINTFYSEKLAEATRKYSNLRSELFAAQDEKFQAKDKKRRKILPKKRNVPAKKMQELKLAFSEFYLSLILLQNYQNLNFTGFRKILKKHDKLLSVEVGAKWRINHVESSHFYTNKDIDRLIHETESSVTHELEGGDRQRAMKRLRVPPLGEQQSPWITFKVGLFSGSFTVLLAAVIISAFFHRTDDDWRIVCRLYRGPLLIIEFLFLWGINIYGWRSSGVNHVLIFEMDPRNHLSEQHVIELAAIFGVVWSLSVLSFLYSSALGIPPYANPLLLFIAMFIFLFNPTKTFRHEARFWTLRILTRVWLTPFFFVNFSDFWIADQLNSLVTCFTDLQFIVCFYATNGDLEKGHDANYCVEKFLGIRAFMRALPAWFRFAQCLRRYRDTKEANPHLANAAKYSTSFLVVIFSMLTINYSDYYSTSENPFFYFWLISSMISSCYSYWWDIKLDWGLFDDKPGDNKFLREEIVYSSTVGFIKDRLFENYLPPNLILLFVCLLCLNVNLGYLSFPIPAFYYFGIVEDFILRFGWALSMSLTELGYIHADLMVTILAPLEVFRRFIWNFFRLENEHLNNCGKFRAVRDISVAPIDCSDQTQIIRMMDEENGVTNRRKKKFGPSKKKLHPGATIEGESTDDPDS